MGPNARRWGTRLRCLLGDHELVTDLVPAKPADDEHDAEPARIRLRCLWCPAVTPGWEQGQPAYKRKHDGKDLSLHNPRLAAIEAREAAAEPVAAAGGERRRNLVKFGVAKERRSR